MANASRREFLESAALAQAAARPGGQAKEGLGGRTAPRKLSENLWLVEDTCNVYVIRAGARAVLVDFGSGAVLEHLAAMGVERVDAILHTHHHRDQCQGDGKAARRRIPIHVPAHERHLFADARNFWRNRRIFHLYYVRNDFNTITEDLPVAGALADYSTFRWKEGGVEFFVLPTPGHTLGSITLVATVDGRRTAFSGDLMYAPGKILNLYDTQVNYGGAEGVDHGIYSIERLREQKPALLCPSHGAPLEDPDEGLRKTSQKLAEYYHFQTGGEPVESFRPYVISPHVIGHDLTTASFYAILSNSGKGLFIDYGSASNMHFGTFERATPVDDRIRFVEHSVARLKREYGLKAVDVVMPTHMHDDHMNGFPHLKRAFGTKVWCYENMKDVFENPRGYNLGCILGEEFRVDRTFGHGEKFRWEEYEFEMTHSPGHTEYQMALFGTIDGRRMAFTGDAFFTPEARWGGAMRHNIIFRNHVETDSHLKSVRNLIEHEPEVICPGHGRAFPVNREVMLKTEQRFRRQRELFAELLPEGEDGFGLDPSWVALYPYQPVFTPGRTERLEVRARNYYAAPMKLEVALVAPGEWHVAPDLLRLEVPAGASVTGRLDVMVPKGWAAPGPRFAVALDVARNGKYLGQVTEAVVELTAVSRG